MTRDRILAFAQLLRIPNVFTAFADVAHANRRDGDSICGAMT